MTSVYLVNVGTNTSHGGRARSPIFADGSWVFVSYPTPNSQLSQRYSPQVRPFLRGRSAVYTHADPCWGDLSYGDECANPRALALKRVTKGDILLFWGLLWRNVGRAWDGFTGEHGWYLFGALRVEEIALPGQSVQQVSEHNRFRASRNAHFVNGCGLLPSNHRAFLGDLGSRRGSCELLTLRLGTPQVSSIRLSHRRMEPSCRRMRSHLGKESFVHVGRYGISAITPPEAAHRLSAMQS